MSESEMNFRGTKTPEVGMWCANVNKLILTFIVTVDSGYGLDDLRVAREQSARVIYGHNYPNK